MVDWLSNARRVHDVSRLVSADLPPWPGDPAVEIAPVARIASGDAANVSRLVCSTHAGTHVDAPWHIVDDGATLDSIPPERWLGPCELIDIPPNVRSIEPSHLALRVPPGTERLLLRTRRLLTPTASASFDPDFAALSPAAAEWCVGQGLALIGIDSPSIEAFESDDLLTHRILLGAGILIVEGLDLAAVAPGAYGLLCLPLRLAAGDGAPARVLLIEPPGDRP